MWKNKSHPCLVFWLLLIFILPHCSIQASYHIIFLIFKDLLWARLWCRLLALPRWAGLLQKFSETTLSAWCGGTGPGPTISACLQQLFQAFWNSCWSKHCVFVFSSFKSWFNSLSHIPMSGNSFVNKRFYSLLSSSVKVRAMELVADNCVLADCLVDTVFHGKFMDDLLFQTRCSLCLQKSPLQGLLWTSWKDSCGRSVWSFCPDLYWRASSSSSPVICISGRWAWEARSSQEEDALSWLLSGEVCSGWAGLEFSFPSPQGAAGLSFLSSWQQPIP